LRRKMKMNKMLIHAIIGCFLASTALGFGTGLTKPSKTPTSLVNPCNPDNIPKQPIWTALADLECDSTDGTAAEGPTRVQAGADVTVGTTGTLEAALQPIEDFDAADMCPVNIHWHLGAEHRNEGTFSLNAQQNIEAWEAATGRTVEWEPQPVEGGKRVLEYNQHAAPAQIPQAGHFCETDYASPYFNTEYDWQYCENMHVGLTYEIHWPHSNLGMCDSEWQMQTHFMNGVLCKANQAKMSPADAWAAVFESHTAKIGVQSQVFTIFNSDAGAEYDHITTDESTWDPLMGWSIKGNEAANDIAVYQGSTTGQQNGNEDCRGTGGMVTWQVHRACNSMSAQKFDMMCKAMLEQTNDMSSDIHPHNARQTIDIATQTNVEMAPGASQPAP